MGRGLTTEELDECIALLEQIVGDRMILETMEPERRVKLMIAAGRVSRPMRDEVRRSVKALRRVTRAKARHVDRETIAATEIRTARKADVFVPPPRLVGGATDPSPRELAVPRDCYVCKEAYTRVHFFYDALCPSCADRNYEKRFQTASLDGQVAVITGARIKIGYQAALMMLRAGARVIVTTRFPRDAAQRFSREPDFPAFRERLEVFGLDLRHSPSVEEFARYLGQTESRLDIVINNAAQTVRRPAAFYAHMRELEERPFEALPDDVAVVLRRHERREVPSRTREVAGLLAWASGEAASDQAMFPVGRSDADLQQVDLRATNSWRLALGDVPSAEMLEVQLVNAVAPFILCSKLKPLMLRSPSPAKHIVNVSAMEGKFARRTKTDKHPHTNMAKASLNMLTLTSAPDYVKDGIYMNAVDTGWVTDEDPFVLSERKRERHDFQPPLDIVDGAARICDPFFSGILTGNHVYGKFLKDYEPTDW